MSTIPVRMNPPVAPLAGADDPPPLENGDHLDQPTFHARYEVMPKGIKAELIGGIVYLMPSPLHPRHGRPHAHVMGWLWTYEGATPSTGAMDNTTQILGPDSEPQPDCCLVVLPRYGGRTREGADGYLTGPPELVVEVASSSQAIELGAKRVDYERAGVPEYVVAALRQRLVYWFVLRNGRYEPLPPGPDGILRSEVFPGLWLDSAALLRFDAARQLDVLRQGLASTEHAAFVAKLAADAAPNP